MCDCYVFAIEMDRITATTRTIVKVSYASMLPRAPGALHHRLLRKAFSHESLILRLATAAASSTHVEIETPPSMRVAAIRAFAIRNSRGSIASSVPTFQDRPVQSAHRVHMLTGLSQPGLAALTPLIITVTPPRSGIVSGAAVAAIVNLIIQILLVLNARIAIDRAIRPTRDQPLQASEIAERLGVFRDTNAYSVSILAVSLATALAVVVQLHFVERRIYRVPKMILIGSVICLVTSLLTLAYEAAVGPNSVFDWDRNGPRILVLSAGLSLWAILVLARCGRPDALHFAQAAPRSGRTDLDLHDSQYNSLVATEGALFAGLDSASLNRLIQRFSAV
jgi:hypothetical protein